MSQTAPVTTGPSRIVTAARPRASRLRRVADSRWGPAVVLIVAAATRLIGLGYPHALIFDETYYVKDAWSLWHLGYEGSWLAKNPDSLFARGAVNTYSPQASYIAHPPFGKWIIGLGEVLSGGAENSFGWRVSVAVAGILAVALLMLIAHRMFRTPFVTTLAGGLLAVDDNAITLSRVGLLDDLVMLFALVAFALVLEDRIRAERRLAAWLVQREHGAGAWGPTLWWRPWLLAGGIALGLDSAIKWSGLYFLVAFLAYAVGSDLLLRRRAGVRFWPGGLLKQGPILAVTGVVPAVLAYLAGWTGWFLTSGGYDRHAIEDHLPGATAFTGALAWVPLPLQDLWQWTRSIYVFHTTLDSPHPYASPAWQWPLLIRPTSMWWDDKTAGTCGSGNCVSAIVDLPNPLIWYAAVAASVYLLVRFVRRHEWQAGLILMGLVGGYLPWLLYPKRTMFFFYTIAFEPYMLLALAATIGLMVMRPPAADSPDELVAVGAASGLRTRRGIVLVFLAVAVVLSAFYLPLATGLPITYDFWHLHMWSPSWI